MLKLCKKCLVEKPIDKFYKHSEMADGHLNKCKECAKADVSENRAANLEYYKQYDRMRYDVGGSRRKTSVSSEVSCEASRRWRLAHPVEKSCHAKVQRAVESGVLVKARKCSWCGRKGRTEAHHPDYARQLEVLWLCKKCHGKTWSKPRMPMEPRKKGGWKPPMQPTRAKGITS